ncbi:putative peptidase S13, D-Ala-D-Ala carboxypeptidase C [cyanobacterium endosymbiont of Rhopalodia gibberula]|uniref:D-alanyl-D-alanine carboxypeptidase n=1 Tax=cyanobacterium endosymbiont of Rhopalodia gibberula TaxID=1763363 RepID=UPI000DC709AD|nr:D-alanyl-D-alanine carboxypeptidase [cyanobacterium endosymbiont of Rhopalodia gibberula]BBA80118.1 putative peptidase S13, D-Ala-D-Ala carboxypeptidase C [cyanobacterium endosymbiont of Rhopalodia gibberula]
MQELFGLAIANLLINVLRLNPEPLQPIMVAAWQQAKIFDVPTTPDPIVEKIVADYLQNITALGFSLDRQGVWIQSDWAYLGQNQSNIPLSAASLTKIATSIAALETWKTDHHFETLIYRVGSFKDGVLIGDLVIQGNGDPLFVWEEAITLGNHLNKLGIRQVTGNLIIVDNFSMNFKSNPQTAGELLKVGLDKSRWPRIIEQKYQNFLPNTPRPQVAIMGKVQVQSYLPEGSQLLILHQSLTLAELLKQMNLYSNNAMAESLAQSMGGAKIVAQKAARAANVPLEEIQLINGSGLGLENRISPQASVAMLIGIQEKLKGHPINVTDIFPMAGRDTTGTVKWRNLPDGVAVKTGTLAQVSALAGVISTKERGQVWFSIINHGHNIDRFRAEQDRLLQRLADHWQLTNFSSTQQTKPYLGDPQRNKLKAKS